MLLADIRQVLAERFVVWVLNICNTEIFHNRMQAIQGIVLDIYLEVKYWIALVLRD